MTPEERALIDGLFDRMRAVEGQPRDAEAEALIARRSSEAPHATYTLAQTVLVQEHALQQAAARIQELEAQAQKAQQAAAQPTSFLGGLLGSRGTSVPTAGARSDGPMGLPQGYNAQQAQPPGYAPQPAPQGYGQAPGPWGQQPQRPGLFGGGGGGGGGFLQGALATAAGVAGGALLFQGIQGLMSHGTGPIANQAASLLEQPAAAAGDLASQAQEALGGAPDTNVADSGSPDPWNTASADPGYTDAGYDDGGDFGGDDSNWA
ncbi:hypothetical protein DFO45_2120 [Azorhizobium sp. AG788]|uniref:DUF2076 domain-containing protein n=1 Tax=Azorhizobium sp. AG788 TaxID=2183897 RepID=UPI00105E5959|nr:DUF2076 domain-containing protein [Azorhizobium sp. AG788]TDT96917.1 hypothetical protein DFO45_2120 [Azorhizobium sp. AG788]